MDQEVAKTLGELELKLQALERELTSIGRRRDEDNQPSGSSSLSSLDAPTEPVNALAGPPPVPSVPLDAPGRLIDEAVERERDTQGDTEQHTYEETAADGGGLGGPPVFGGEEVPSQAGATIERNWAAPTRETAYGEIPTPPAFTPPPGLSHAPGSSHVPGSSHAPGPSHVPGSSHAPGPSHAPGSSHAPGPSYAPGPSHTPPSPPPHMPRPPLPQEHQSIDVVDLVRFKEKLQRTMEDLIDEYSRLLSPKPPS